MHNNTQDYHFTTHVGMCGGGGVSFCSERYSVFVDEDGEEYGVFDSANEQHSIKEVVVVWSLWYHHTGYKAMSLALTPEFIELAGTCLSHAVNNRWNEGKVYLQTWQNPTL